jgi:hypothetical protein
LSGQSTNRSSNEGCQTIIAHREPSSDLAKGDKLTVTVERIDGGKLRCTGATWNDAVVIHPNEARPL